MCGVGFSITAIRFSILKRRLFICTSTVFARDCLSEGGTAPARWPIVRKHQSGASHVARLVHDERQPQSGSLGECDTDQSGQQRSVIGVQGCSPGTPFFARQKKNSVFFFFLSQRQRCGE